MRTDDRLQSDDERAVLWLKHSLEWEEILRALRDAGGGNRHEPAPPTREPAAA